MSLTSIVLPVHNQASFIEKVVDDYLAALERVPGKQELILVANGCTDGSEAICEQLAADIPHVDLVVLEQGGWGRAVKAGLHHARGERLCYTNSARTTSEVLTLMLLYAQTFPEVVVKANRRIRDNWRRRVGSLLYNVECRSLFDLTVWDINGTPKIFPSTFESLLDLKRDDDLIDAEFSWVCRRRSYPVVEVPILATTRLGGRTTTSWRSALRMYWGALEMSRQPT